MNMKSLNLIRILLLLALAVAFIPSARAETVLVAAGAGYKRPVAELAEAFEKQTGNRVEQIYGHMAGVIAQARQSGQVAVVFGDLAYLEKADGLRFSGFLPVGRGRLVIGWPKGAPIKALADLAEKRIARIALPDTKAAIYGIAAVECLHNSGLEDKVRDRLQVVATVPQVSAYLISGEVDAGLFNLTEALAIKDRIGGYLEVSPTLYSPIRIVAGVVKGFENQAVVKALSEFLQSPEAQRLLDKHGL
jgi:molybdate transport system substrate-binding protein